MSYLSKTLLLSFHNVISDKCFSLTMEKEKQNISKKARLLEHILCLDENIQKTYGAKMNCHTLEHNENGPLNMVNIGLRHPLLKSIRACLFLRMSFEL